ncbi:MAG: methyltransferase domain-containing protein [Phycisphaerales bacterium]|nr:methyltransferase domain-containing protein [Phycisphaerales bacterium]
MTGSTLRDGMHRLVRKMLRPGTAPIEHKLDRVLASLDGPRLGTVWRGGRAGGAYRPDGSSDPEATRRMRQELLYWIGAAENRHGEFPDGMAETFRRWQRIRLYELARCLGKAEGLEVGGPLVGDMADWLAGQRAVEIGGGPWPCVAAAGFATALVVDPLAEGYLAEGLITPEASRVTYLAAPGEAIPLPAGGTDLVITDNCLDHVQDPARVAREMGRLLRPGGLLWLLVDVMDQADELHPHPMSESRASDLLTAAGLRQRWGEVWDGHSHPRAKGQWRTLWERPA